MGKLILSAFSDEYSDDFDEQLAVLKNNGFDFTELRHADGKNVADFTKDDVKTLKKKLDDNGIKVSSIGSPLGKIKLDGELTEHFEKAKRVFETANELGAKYCRVFSFYAPEGRNVADCKIQVLDALSSLLRVSDEFDITLCHENEALIYGESPDACLEILDYFDGELRCVFDMGNFVLDGYKPYPDAYKKLFKYIEYFHIKDSLYEGAIVPAGKGQAQIKEILDDYKANGNKDAFITLEPHLQTFDGLNALVGKAFDNPYKYNDQKEAFLDAIAKLKELL